MQDGHPPADPPVGADSETASGSESEPSFEAALAGLEAIVDRLEQGDLELEAALADFERGVALARRCAGQLETAERRIEVLVQQGEQWIRAPLDDDPEGDEGPG
jgi:exodeoxyribonuclease VII small subunit